jgi:hypothetical protein
MRMNTSGINVAPPFSIARTASIIPAFAAAFIALSSFQTRADTIALSFTGGSPALANQSQTAGWEFSLSNPILLTQLGLWDRFDNGLVESHVVTVWTSTGTEVAQATIPAGASATLTDGFRYVSLVNSIVLPAGDYTIGAFYNLNSGDLAVVGASTVSTASGVTYGGSRLAFGDAFPTGDAGGNPNSYFGPNFQFTTPTSAPDAGSAWTLLLASLAATLGLKVALPKKV